MADSVSVAELERAANRQRTLLNPMKVVFTFQWGGVPYHVEPGTAKVFPAYLAEHGAKHLAHFLKDHVEHRFEDAVDEKGNVKLGSYATPDELARYANDNLLDQVPVEDAQALYQEVEGGLDKLTPEQILGENPKEVAKRISKKAKGKKAEKDAASEVEETLEAGEDSAQGAGGEQEAGSEAESTEDADA